jgi:NAD(P)-dependent dehydrogenase (short-subunit alcohol dehydrogenase family)
MARKKPVSDQAIVIAGGSYGLGRAIAGEAARKGARVVVGARTTEALTGSLADIEAEGSEGLTVKTDVSERDQVDWLVAAAVERFGRIDTDRHIRRECDGDGLLRSAPARRRRAPTRLRRQLLRQRLRLLGVAAALTRHEGTFVQIDSALSYRGIPLQAAYCATKAALRTFFESARLELQKERGGVDVCVVLPGAINTPQFDRARQRMGFQPQPVSPIYQPEPFAAAVVRCLRTA